ncbi:hypothetical protein BGZ49_000929, partial [Haplosporangium sp. Z 27]
ETSAIDLVPVNDSSDEQDIDTYKKRALASESATDPLPIFKPLKFCPSETA